MLLVSAIAYRIQDSESMAAGVTVDNFYLHNIWIAGFGIIASIVNHLEVNGLGFTPSFGLFTSQYVASEKSLRANRRYTSLPSQPPENPLFSDLEPDTLFRDIVDASLFKAG